MPRVTIRMTENEAKALEQLPGKDTSARVRYLLHQSTLVVAIRAEIDRAHGALASKIIGAGAQINPISETLSASEFRVALSMIAGLISVVLPADKKVLAANVSERILDGVQATPDEIKSAIHAATSKSESTRSVTKTEHPLRPPAVAGAAAGAAEIEQLFGSKGGAK